MPCGRTKEKMIESKWVPDVVRKETLRIEREAWTITVENSVVEKRELLSKHISIAV